MATCNGARYLRPQLLSIGRQERLPDELVIRDDASEDDTVELLDKFAETAPFPVRIWRSPVRSGVTQNFESALALAQGAVVVLSDQDDVWGRTKISRLVERFESDPATTVVVSNATVVDANLRPLGYSLWDALRFTHKEQMLVRAGKAFEVLSKHNFVTAGTIAVRRSALGMCFPFPRLHSVHDYWIGLILSLTGTIRLEERPLAAYRLHGGNLIGIKKRSLRELIGLARRQCVDGHFARNLQLFRSVHARIAAIRPTSALSSAILDEKIEHTRIRREMSVPMAARLFGVFREWMSGRYGRFSYGSLSALQDLFLRAVEETPGSLVHAILDDPRFGTACSDGLGYFAE